MSCLFILNDNGEFVHLSLGVGDTFGDDNIEFPLCGRILANNPTPVPCKVCKQEYVFYFIMKDLGVLI